MDLPEAASSRSASPVSARHVSSSSGLGVVRAEGLEPPRPKPPEPKSGVSTNSTTPAHRPSPGPGSGAHPQSLAFGQVSTGLWERSAQGISAAQAGNQRLYGPAVRTIAAAAPRLRGRLLRQRACVATSRRSRRRPRPALTSSIAPPIRQRTHHSGGIRPVSARIRSRCIQGSAPRVPLGECNGECSRRSPQQGACGSERFCLCR